MNTETGKLSGHQLITDDLVLLGMIVGDATVSAGAHLDLNGIVTGNLTVQEGATCDLRGTVSGSVYAAGVTNVWGVVSGSASGAGLVVYPDSIVGDRRTN